MDYNFGNITDVQFIDSSTGEVISKMQSLDVSSVEHEWVYLNSNPDFRFKKSFSVTLEDATFNTDVLDKMLFAGDPNIVFVAENPKINKYKYLHKRTKNRRIKNKLIKQIQRLDHAIYNEGIKMKYSQITFN